MMKSCCALLRIMCCFEPHAKERECMPVTGNNVCFLLLLRKKNYVSSLSIDTEVAGLNLRSSEYIRTYNQSLKTLYKMCACIRC